MISNHGSSWPGSAELEVLVAKIKRMSPELIEKTDPRTGAKVPTKLEKAIETKLANDRMKYRRILACDLAGVKLKLYFILCP